MFTNSVPESKFTLTFEACLLFVFFKPFNTRTEKRLELRELARCNIDPDCLATTDSDSKAVETAADRSILRVGRTVSFSGGDIKSSCDDVEGVFFFMDFRDPLFFLCFLPIGKVFVRMICILWCSKFGVCGKNTKINKIFCVW